MELSAAEAAVLALLRSSPTVIDSLRAFLDAAATPEPVPVVEPEPEPEPEPPPPPFEPPASYERDGKTTVGYPSRVRYEWQGGADGEWKATRVPHWTPHEPIIVERPHELTGRPIKSEYKYNLETGETHGRCITSGFETDPCNALAYMRCLAGHMLNIPKYGLSNIDQAMSAAVYTQVGSNLFEIVKAAGLAGELGEQFGPRASEEHWRRVLEICR